MSIMSPFRDEALVEPESRELPSRMAVEKAPLPGPPGPAAPALDAVTGTVEVTGRLQRPFSARIAGLSHDLVSPRDATTGFPTGKRQHRPVEIRKAVDKTTPLLVQALLTNENLTNVRIAILDGKATTMTIELQNASVASRSQRGREERVAFVYQKVTWTWVDGGVTTQDDWQATTV
jgi:type VI secretion system secreted protein Hcp